MLFPWWFPLRAAAAEAAARWSLHSSLRFVRFTHSWPLHHFSMHWGPHCSSTCTHLDNWTRCLFLTHPPFSTVVRCSRWSQHCWLHQCESESAQRVSLIRGGTPELAFLPVPPAAAASAALAPLPAAAAVAVAVVPLSAAAAALAAAAAVPTSLSAAVAAVAVAVVAPSGLRLRLRLLCCGDWARAARGYGCGCGGCRRAQPRPQTSPRAGRQTRGAF